MQKQDLDGYLNDLEREKVAQFHSDEVMREAVKKIICAGLYKAGVGKPGEPLNTLYNPALIMVSQADKTGATNEQLGESVRALWAGINQLEAGFENLKLCLPAPNERPKKINPAR